MVDLIQKRDVAALSALLAQDIILVSDGGTTAPAFGKPIDGRDRIARFLVGSPHLLGSDLRPDFASSPSGEFLLLREAGRLRLIVFAGMDGDRINRLFTLSDLVKLDQFPGL